MKKHLIIEKVCKNREHNGFIKSYLRFYQEGRFSFYGNKHLAKNVLDDKKYRRYKGEADYTEILKLVLRNEVDITFLSANIPIVIFSILLSSFSNVKSIRIIPHAILNQIYFDSIDTSPKGWVKKLIPFIRFGFWIKYATKFKKIKVVVLGKSICENFSRITGIDKIFWIHHPYDLSLPSKNEVVTEGESERELKIGFVGIGSKDKGFFDLVEFLQQHQTKAKVKFYHIGPTSDKKESAYCNLVPVFNSSTLVERELFEEKIRAMDYIILPLPNDEYKLRASGSFFDAIKYEKPIIYTKNDFVHSYIKGNEALGIEFDIKNGKMDELYNLIISSDRSKYASNMANLKLELFEKMKSGTVHDYN
ncbi:hypothetical protein AB6D16_014805 [Vibrio cyclitrophicus]